MTSEITGETLRKEWKAAIYKVLGAIPRLILGRKNTEPTGPKKDLITRIIIAVIACLSAASVTNLSYRAYQHHADWNSYLVGGGLALGVPLSVYIAIYVEEKRIKVFVWCIAVLFAVTSGLIQFQVYLPATKEITWDARAEAIAFGFGVPLGECLFAAMEAVLQAQAKRKKVEEEKSKEEEETKKRLQLIEEQRAADERQANLQRLADERAYNLRKQEIELANFQAEQAQRLELDRLKLESKLASKVSKSVSKEPSKLDSNTPIGQVNGQTKMDKMLDIFMDNPATSRRKVAELLDTSPSTITNWLTRLQAEQRVYINGDGKVHVKGIDNDRV